jgi:DNA-binding NarL/FixJ family response regulator
LIVEDDYLVAVEMEAVLIAAGFDVAGIATSAKQAVELAMTEEPHVIVMDVRLEGLRDGIEAAVEIFRIKRIRSLFATAYYDPSTKRRAEPAEPLGWLPKPYTMDALVHAVRKAMNEARGQEPTGN